MKMIRHIKNLSDKKKESDMMNISKETIWFITKTLSFAVLVLLILFTGTGCAKASPPAEEWNRTYEGITSVESFQQTADSGYILAGNTRPDTNSDISLVKTGPTGSEQWNRTFGETFSDDRVKSVLQTSDGGYLITGSTSACWRDCPDDVWLIKINTEGIEQWNLTLGRTGYEEMVFVQQTTDGGYILIENTDYRTRFSDIWIVKVDSNGNMQWNNTLGGIGQDNPYSVSQIPGGYIIAGKTDSYGSGTFDFWLVKTDTKGEEQWNNTYGGYSGDIADSIQQTHDGGYIIAGTTNSFGASHLDFLLVKTDSNGKEQWYRTFGGVSLELDSSVQLSPDGGYILGGRTLSFDDGDYWLIKTDKDGNMQWDRTFKGHGFQQTPDGGYIIKGHFYDPSKNFGVQKALIKTDSNGNEQWDIKIEGDELDSVLQTDDGGYILAGTKDSNLLLVKLMAERPAPTAQFTYDPGNPVANQSITFDASASFDPYGNITYYQWDMGDGSYVNTTQRTVTHSYDEGGNYIVGLTVTGSNDEVSSTTLEIIVQQSGPPIMRWNKTFGGASDDWVHSLEYTSDGGYILAGSSHFFTGKGIDVDAMLVKTDLNGNMQWQRTIGGIGRDEAYSTIQTSDGGYIMVGTTESYGAGSYDFWLVKTDAKGIEQWNRTFGCEDLEEDISFLQTSDGGYIMVGTTRPLLTGSYNLRLVKTDAKGIEQWNRTFGEEDYDDTAPSIRQASDGGYIIAGTTESYGAGSDDFWLIKTDPEGIEQWNRTFGGEDYDWLKSFQQTFDGGYILGGPTRSFGNGSFDFWLVKTDNNGIEQWNRTFEGKENVIGYIASSVQQTLDGGFILEGVTGSTNSFDCWLVKTDSEGEEVWNRTFGHDGDNIPRSILQTPDGGYVIVGETGSEGPEPYDAWLFRTDADGHEQWETTLGGPGRDVARFVLLAPDGNLVVAGDKDLHNEQGTDFWLIKLGGVPVEPEDGNAPTDAEPVQTPDMPGFGAVVAVMGLLVWVGLAGRRR
jgi:PGF-CTERM protein